MFRFHDQGRSAESTAAKGAAALLGVVAMGLIAASPTAALERTLVAADGAGGDSLGGSVAIDGDTIVAGAPGDDGGKGAVYVFRRAGDDWDNVAKLIASNGAAGDGMGTAVAIDGDTIVAGAPLDDIPLDTDRGTVYTFARTGAAVRNETARLTASDGAAGDNLGGAVAIDGDTIVAGADSDDEGTNTSQGSAYTFARTGAVTRQESAKLVSSDAAMGDRLGFSVAIEGDTIVAGAPFKDGYRGAAFTFDASGPTPRDESARLAATDGAAGDFFGNDVAIDGETVVVSAFADDVGGNVDQGSAYTFSRTGATLRTETAKLTASDGEPGDFLGSVAIDGVSIIGGAGSDDVGMKVDQGSAYAFAASGPPTREETGRLFAADGDAGDGFGAVAVEGPTVVVGAVADTVGTNDDQGSATVFFSPAPVPDTTAPKTSKIEGPKKIKRGKKAKFRFSSNEPDSRFECKLDKKRYRDCISPLIVKTRRLGPGRHTVRAFAVDAVGNPDPTPESKRFKVAR